MLEFFLPIKCSLNKICSLSLWLNVNISISNCYIFAKKSSYLSPWVTEKFSRECTGVDPSDLPLLHIPTCVPPPPTPQPKCWNVILTQWGLNPLLSCNPSGAVLTVNPSRLYSETPPLKPISTALVVSHFQTPAFKGWCHETDISLAGL